jgi:hypothetical protein
VGATAEKNNNDKNITRATWTTTRTATAYLQQPAGQQEQGWLLLLFLPVQQTGKGSRDAGGGGAGTAMDHQQKALAYFERFKRALREKKVADPGELKAAIQRLLEGKASNNNATGFPGMQPASLDKQEMYKMARRKDDYYVCEKTDGERFLLLLYRGKTYLVDRRHDFFDIPRVRVRACCVRAGDRRRAFPNKESCWLFWTRIGIMIAVASSSRQTGRACWFVCSCSGIVWGRLVRQTSPPWRRDPIPLLPEIVAVIITTITTDAAVGKTNL